MYLEQLRLYANKIEEAGYSCWVLPADQDKKISELLILMNVDALARDYVMQVMYVNELAEDSGIGSPDNSIFMLQSTMRLPFPVSEPYFSDVARLLHLINALLPIGQLILSEMDKSVSFRGILAHTSPNIESALFVEATKMTNFLLMPFIALIEQVATGVSSYAQTLEMLAESGKMTAV